MTSGIGSYVSLIWAAMLSVTDFVDSHRSSFHKPGTDNTRNDAFK